MYCERPVSELVWHAASNRSRAKAERRMVRCS
jgi:hypothetical protein